MLNVPAVVGIVVVTTVANNRVPTEYVLAAGGGSVILVLATVVVIVRQPVVAEARVGVGPRPIVLVALILVVIAGVVVVEVVAEAEVVRPEAVAVEAVEVVYQIAFAEWMSLVSVDRHVAPPMIRLAAEAVHHPVALQIAVGETAVADRVPIQIITGAMEPAPTVASVGHEPIPAPIRQV